MGAAVVAEGRCLPAAAGRAGGGGGGGGLSVQLTGADSAEQGVTQPDIKHRCSATKQPAYSLLNLPGC